MSPATVLWLPEAAIRPQQPGTPIFHRGQDWQFGSLESAVRFVIEALPEAVRSTAMIQTDDRILSIRRHSSAARGLTPKL